MHRIQCEVAGKVKFYQSSALQHPHLTDNKDAADLFTWPNPGIMALSRTLDNSFEGTALAKIKSSIKTVEV